MLAIVGSGCTGGRRCLDIGSGRCAKLVDYGTVVDVERFIRAPGSTRQGGRAFQKNVAVQKSGGRSWNAQTQVPLVGRLGTKTRKSVGIKLGEGVCVRAALDERRANDSRVGW